MTSITSAANNVPRFIASKTDSIKDVLAQKTSISKIDKKKNFSTSPGEMIVIKPRSTSSKEFEINEQNKQIRFEFFIESGNATFSLRWICGGDVKFEKSAEYSAGVKHKFIFQPQVDNAIGKVKLFWSHKQIFQSKKIKFASIIEKISIATINALLLNNNNNNKSSSKADDGVAKTDNDAETDSSKNINNGVMEETKIVELIEKFQLHYDPHNDIDAVDKKTCGGTLGHLTDKEKGIFKEFKALVTPEDIKTIQIPFEKDDYVLLRFLRARKFVIKDTKLMWDNHLKWRQESELEENLVRSHEDIAGLALKDLCEFYPTGYGGTDRFGRPVMIKLVGTANLPGALKSSTVEKIVTWETRNSELLKNVLSLYSHKGGRHIENFCCIVDLKGFTMSQVTNDVWKLMKLSNSTTADNYPESLGVFFILNAPFYFRAVWNVIKTFVDARTIKKFKILGSSFQGVLHEHVDIDNLPKEYGGSGKYGFKSLEDLKTESGYELFEIAKVFVSKGIGKKD